MTTSAPRADRRPHTIDLHGDSRTDEYFWLREKENPEVIALLEAENAHTQERLAHTKAGQERLFEEIRSRIQETDLSVPVRKNDWWYYSRTEEGRQYAIHCRVQDEGGRPGDETKEHVFFDTNAEAGENYFSMGTFDISPDANFLAYSIDREGDEKFELHFRDLRSGEELPDVISEVQYGGAWCRDASVFFYSRSDDTQRPFQVWRHVMGTASADDFLVYQEDDERFRVGVGLTRTEDWLELVSASSLTSEVRLLHSDDPTGEFALFEPRREGVEYYVEHHRGELGDTFYVLTNDDAPNSKLMRTHAAFLGSSHWEEVVPHRDNVKLDGVETFAGHLVLSERMNANTQIAVIDLRDWRRTVIEHDEDVYAAGTSGNATFDTSVLRFAYTSMVTPRSVYEIDMNTGEQTLLKRQPVLGEFDPALYETKREWATAADGTQVPISLVQRRDRAAGGPAVLYGYGSYEISIDPTFSTLRLSLLDRGFVYAIAHVRGGGGMGRLWYEHGKFNEKKNTFTDFISCAEFMIDNGYTTPDQLVIRGGSAGGMLMGAVTNLRPDLFRAVVADVPFVDVVSTMLDTSLPLTTNEYEEWGNPQDPAVYQYMKSYSPYDNVEDATFPRMLVMGGLNDPRVAYWGPAKWVQRLRDHNTGSNEILLKTEMGAGHMGPTGRYNVWKDEAFIYAFILDSVGTDF